MQLGLVPGWAPRPRCPAAPHRPSSPPPHPPPVLVKPPGCGGIQGGVGRIRPEPVRARTPTHRPRVSPPTDREPESETGKRPPRADGTSVGLEPNRCPDRESSRKPRVPSPTFSSASGTFYLRGASGRGLRRRCWGSRPTGTRTLFLGTSDTSEENVWFPVWGRGTGCTFAGRARARPEARGTLASPGRASHARWWGRTLKKHPDLSTGPHARP